MNSIWGEVWKEQKTASRDIDVLAFVIQPLQV